MTFSNVYLLQLNGKFYNNINKWQILLQYQLMEIYTPLGPTIKEHALSCLGILFAIFVYTCITARKTKYSGPNTLEYGSAHAAYTAMF